MNIDDGIVQVKSATGDTHLGGKDFDNRLVDHFVQEFKSKYEKDLTADKLALHRLRIACEHAKHTLSSRTEATIQIRSLFEGIDFETSISRPRFEALNADLFNAIINVVEKAIRVSGYPKTRIDEIIVTGGSAYIPRVHTILQDLFNGKVLNRPNNSEYLRKQTRYKTKI